MSIGIIAGIVVVVLIGWFIGMYNGLVKLRNNRENAFANIDVQLKQRYDLVPQLVSTVKGYASHEKGTLEGVMEARGKAMGVSGGNLSEENVAAYGKAQGEVSSALNRLLMVVENYPDLKANQNFLDLQAQLEGTENRIAEARRGFNEVAKEYNTYMRTFPNNIIAGMFGFQQKGYFEADEDAKKAPKVEF